MSIIEIIQIMGWVSVSGLLTYVIFSCLEHDKECTFLSIATKGEKIKYYEDKIRTTTEKFDAIKDLLNPDGQTYKNITSDIKKFEDRLEKVINDELVLKKIDLYIYFMLYAVLLGLAVIMVIPEPEPTPEEIMAEKIAEKIKAERRRIESLIWRGHGACKTTFHNMAKFGNSEVEDTIFGNREDNIYKYAIGGTMRNGFGAAVKKVGVCSYDPQTKVATIIFIPG